MVTSWGLIPKLMLWNYSSRNFDSKFSDLVSTRRMKGSLNKIDYFCLRWQGKGMQLVQAHLDGTSSLDNGTVNSTAHETLFQSLGLIKDTLALPQASCAGLHPTTYSFTEDFNCYNMLLMTLRLTRAMESTQHDPPDNEASRDWVRQEVSARWVRQCQQKWLNQKAAPLVVSVIFWIIPNDLTPSPQQATFKSHFLAFFFPWMFCSSHIIWKSLKFPLLSHAVPSA